MPSRSVDPEFIRGALDRVLRRWKAALAAVVGDAGGNVTTVRSLAEALNIGRGTAHNLLRVLQAETLPGIVASLPGRHSRESVLIKCRLARVPSHLLDELDAAQSELEGSLRRYAPTTDRLVAIVCGDASDDDLRRRLLRGFRSRFEIDQLMHGGSADQLIAAQIVVPSADGLHADVAGAQIIDGIRFIRPETQFEVYRGFSRATDGSPPSLCESLCAGLEGVDLAHHQLPDRITSYLIEPNGSYDEGSVALAFCEHSLSRGPLDSEFEDDFAEAACPIYLPTRRLQFEIWLHRQLRRGGDPTPHLYHTRDSSPSAFDRHNRARVPLPADLDLVDAPFAAGGLASPLGARHKALMLEASSRLGCGLEDLDCFRVRLPCPPMGSRVAVRWLLAQKSD